GLISLAPHFHEKSASVENFSDEGEIPLGKDMDKDMGSEVSA
ncbi:MAG: gfo/Idh/MocA family oxidoreductase, partial [Hafnia sp.]